MTVQADTPSGRTVLVTGGAGFIGSHIVDAVAPENDVRVLDDLSTGKRRNLRDGVELVEGDVRDERTRRRAMDGVDVVFHQAGIASVERSTERPTLSHEVNLSATLSLLELARREDARVVLASTCAIYGQPSTVPIDESEPQSPESLYGIQKAGLDHYGRLYHDLYGLETVVLRYFNVYGPRQSSGDYSGVISVFMRQARDGDPITVEGDGSQTRDFVHVDDVVRANLLAATTDRVGEAYNVGTGSSVTILRLAEEIRSAVGSDSEIVHTSSRAGDIDRSCADISKARRRLGYRPSVTLADGLSTLR